jgi:hypothetical protein
MILGKSKSGDKDIPDDPGKNPADIAVVPLALPLLAGPGAISGMILYGSKSNGLEGDIFLTIIALLVSMFVLISLITASRMEKTLNQTGINVLKGFRIADRSNCCSACILRTSADDTFTKQSLIELLPCTQQKISINNGFKS